MEAAKAESMPDVKMVKEVKPAVSQNVSASSKTVSKDRAEAAAFLKVCLFFFW